MKTAQRIFENLTIGERLAVIFDRAEGGALHALLVRESIPDEPYDLDVVMDGYVPPADFLKLVLSCMSLLDDLLSGLFLAQRGLRFVAMDAKDGSGAALTFFKDVDNGWPGSEELIGMDLRTIVFEVQVAE